MSVVKKKFIDNIRSYQKSLVPQRATLKIVTPTVIISVDIYFLGNFVEPHCSLKCEIAKRLARIVFPVPTVPLTPVEQIKEALTTSCAAAFQLITASVINTCTNYDNRLDGQEAISAAADALIFNGFFLPDEFEGVQIRFCPLPEDTSGMAADRGRVYLDTKYMIGAPLETLSGLLAHEMTHISQYRKLGSDNFKCDYSRQFVDCNGCQDRNHPLEREAYEFEDLVSRTFRQPPTPQPFSSAAGDRGQLGRSILASLGVLRWVFSVGARVSEFRSNTNRLLGGPGEWRIGMVAVRRVKGSNSAEPWRAAQILPSCLYAGGALHCFATLTTGRLGQITQAGTGMSAKVRTARQSGRCSGTSNTAVE